MMVINGQKDVEQTEPIELKLRDVSMFSITPPTRQRRAWGKRRERSLRQHQGGVMTVKERGNEMRVRARVCVCVFEGCRLLLCGNNNSISDKCMWN